MCALVTGVQTCALPISGRQGDPGSSQAITAIDDELYTLFAPRAAKLVQSTAKASPVEGRAADIPRRLAPGAAERRHAASRPQPQSSDAPPQQPIALSAPHTRRASFRERLCQSTSHPRDAVSLKKQPSQIN